MSILFCVQLDLNRFKSIGSGLSLAKMHPQCYMEKEYQRQTWCSPLRIGIELGKLGSLFGKKKNKSLSIPILGEDNKSESRINKRPIFVNYKLTESPGENVIHLKSERKDKHVNFFELQITFKNNPKNLSQQMKVHSTSELPSRVTLSFTFYSDSKFIS
jgi:hypothetical protein